MLPDESFADGRWGGGMAVSSSPMFKDDSQQEAASPKGPAGLALAARGAPRHARMLLIVVIALGILLLAGFGTVVVRIIYLAGQPARQAPLAAANPRALTLALPAGAQVRHASVTGDRLAVTYDGPQHSGILVMDLSTGEVISRVQFVEEIPRR
jgi:hypothetical protein